ncbi:hypothetical protein [Herbaspirillum sp. RV1423]|uniref:hypothetical protein n=1 Tax=Herbaspirillum sp. RV1423 TaxID=1443993 RepID=UPI0004B83E09|nr:hypothetical protein [Herbaspirillum sp. RV1423]
MADAGQRNGERRQRPGQGKVNARQGHAGREANKGHRAAGSAIHQMEICEWKIWVVFPAEKPSPAF